MTGQVVITGANGWIGGRLASHLKAQGWEVTGVSRTPEQAREKQPEINWVGLDDDFDDAVRRIGVVVNLAGRNLLEQAWDDAFRKAMRDSRVELTRRITRALHSSPAEERILISGSGYPVYGDTGDALVNEDHPVNRATFTAALDAEWEEAAQSAPDTRVALMRLGLVLGADGGAFPVLRQPFEQGAGIILGSGNQWIPWIHIDDAVELLTQALADSGYSGPINVCAPHPIRHKECAGALADRMNVPCEIIVPEEDVINQMGGAAELVLLSTRCVPERAQALGYAFRYAQLEDALRSLA